MELGSAAKEMIGGGMSSVQNVKIQFLYKYLKREHALAMLKAGAVRIGTLRGYRSAELGPTIGDVGEG